MILNTGCSSGYSHLCLCTAGVCRVQLSETLESHYLPIVTNAGSASAPAIYCNAGTTSGIFWQPNGNGIAISNGISMVMHTASSQVYMDSQLNMQSNPIQMNASILNTNNTSYMGQGQLSGGTTTIQCVHANSSKPFVFLTRTNVSGSTGTLYLNNFVNGTSFDVVSTNSGDTGSFNWVMFTS